MIQRIVAWWKKWEQERDRRESEKQDAELAVRRRQDEQVPGEWWVIVDPRIYRVRPQSENPSWHRPEHGAVMDLPEMPVRELDKGQTLDSAWRSILRVTPPVGTPYRVVTIGGNHYRCGDTDPYYSEPAYDVSKYARGPFSTLREAEASFAHLSAGLKCAIYIVMNMQHYLTIDAQGVLRCYSYMEEHPELEYWDWGGPREYLFHQCGRWLPEGVAKDWEPERTRTVLKFCMDEWKERVMTEEYFTMRYDTWKESLRQVLKAQELERRGDAGIVTPYTEP